MQGFTQVWLKDYHDTFSAVATLTTFRLLINLAAIIGWVVYTIDVSQAYTQGELREEIFMCCWRPDKYPGASNTSTSKRDRMRTAKAVVLYEAGWQVLVPARYEDAEANGLTQASKDSCLFIQRTNTRT